MGFLVVLEAVANAPARQNPNFLISDSPESVRTIPAQSNRRDAPGPLDWRAVC